MTEQEAIERIKNLKGKAECALLTEDKKEHWLYEDVQETVEAFGMAIEALEKQEKYERIKQFIKPLCDSEKFCEECIFINEDGYCIQDLL